MTQEEKYTVEVMLQEFADGLKYIPAYAVDAREGRPQQRMYWCSLTLFDGNLVRARSGVDKVACGPHACVRPYEYFHPEAWDVADTHDALFRHMQGVLKTLMNTVSVYFYHNLISYLELNCEEFTNTDMLLATVAHQGIKCGLVVAEHEEGEGGYVFRLERAPNYVCADGYCHDAQGRTTPPPT